MIAVAREAGADAIKFQTFKAAEFVGDPAQTYSYRSQGRDVTESMLDMFRRYELPREAWFAIKAECDRQNIIFLSTPQNRTDLDVLLEVGVPAVKVGSDDFTNLPLLKSYAATGLPLILSCGMADMAEVYRSLETVGALDGYPVVLLLCTSQYPTPPGDVNLRQTRNAAWRIPRSDAGFLGSYPGSFGLRCRGRLRGERIREAFHLESRLCRDPIIGSPKRRIAWRSGHARSARPMRCWAVRSFGPPKRKRTTEMSSGV